MDWYSSVGRKLFFALPPEASHELALALLRLPLPWERIAGSPRSDPALSKEIAGSHLSNPIGLAAGFDKRCARLGSLGRLGFGYVVGGTITSKPRRGSPKPRIVRYPNRHSFVNSMGLPNPGPDVAAKNLSAGARTAPRWVSIADEPLKDALVSFGAVEPFADAIELNASCPNVSWGRDRDDEAHLGQLVREFRARTGKPIFVKLAPFDGETERDGVLGLADAVLKAGASGLTCSNTRLVAEPRLATGRGGLSGGALSERTLGIVRELHEATGAKINACGGILSASDALSCFDAGATTVQVYAALIFTGPAIVSRMTSELSKLLISRGSDVRASDGSAA
jgi:dihydroorotate dehydrogenase